MSDLISRQDAIAYFFRPYSNEELYSNIDIEKALNALQSAPDSRQHGEWVPSGTPNEKYVCSNCGGACWYYDVEKDVCKSRFCPSCGADMRGKE